MTADLITVPHAFFALTFVAFGFGVGAHVGWGMACRERDAYWGVRTDRLVSAAAALARASAHAARRAYEHARLARAGRLLPPDPTSDASGGIADPAPFDWSREVER